MALAPRRVRLTSLSVLPVSAALLLLVLPPRLCAQPSAAVDADAETLSPLEPVSASSNRSLEESGRGEFFKLRSLPSESLPRLPKRLLGETSRFFGSRETLKPLALGAFFAVMAYPYDHQIRFSLAETPALGRHRDAVFRLGSIGGSRLGTFGAAAALIGIGSLTDNPRLKSTGQQGLEALILTNVVVGGIKAAARRQRPDGSTRDSFPSGHAANIFALASVVQQNHGLKVALPVYTFGAFVAYSRVNDDRHFLSDVILGASVGFAIGRTVGLFHKKRFFFSPILGRETRGVNFILTY